MNGCFVCPHASVEYAKSRADKYHFDERIVHDCGCFKPELGMIFGALEKEGVKREDVNVYVIGDRVTDVKTGINAGGTGILVPFENEPGHEEEVKKLDQEKVYIAKDFLDAAKYIVENEKNNQK